MNIVSFDKLQIFDLIVDAVFEGGAIGNISDEPISKILPGVANQSGFRCVGKGINKKLVVLFSSLNDKDWPDYVNTTTGLFTYFGDNKTPGRELHDTSKNGNKLLAEWFSSIHSDSNARINIPPFFIFTQHPTANSQRSVQFRGVAVPGHFSLTSTQDLIAIWKTTEGQRFQNYKSHFSILNIPVVKRKWIDDILDNNANSANAPTAWKAWVATGEYQMLTSKPTKKIRSINEQTPDTKTKNDIVQLIYNQFIDSPVLFERFAAKIFEMHDSSRVIIDEITQASVDGGRDAIGRYQLGITDDPIYADFSLEAKCYRPQSDNKSANTIGVKEVQRLISRIRHRQFGVLITTSLISRQAYQEVRDDEHPIIFICGKDLAEILIEHGYNTLQRVKTFLTTYTV